MNFKLLTVLTVSLVCAKDAYAMDGNRKFQHDRIDQSLNMTKPNSEGSEDFTALLGRAHVINYSFTHIGNNGYNAFFSAILSKLKFAFNGNGDVEINCYDAVHELNGKKNSVAQLLNFSINPKQEPIPTIPSTWRSKLSNAFSSTPALLGYGFVSALGLAALNTKYNFTSYFPSFLKK
jgi:hypothetical protein